MLYYIRIHSADCEPTMNCDVVGPFESMNDAYNGAKLIRAANDSRLQFSYVSETVRASHYDTKEVMPLAYYC